MVRRPAALLSAPGGGCCGEGCGAGCALLLLLLLLLLSAAWGAAGWPWLRRGRGGRNRPQKSCKEKMNKVMENGLWNVFLKLPNHSHLCRRRYCRLKKGGKGREKKEKKNNVRYYKKCLLKMGTAKMGSGKMG